MHDSALSALLGFRVSAIALRTVWPQGLQRVAHRTLKKQVRKSCWWKVDVFFGEEKLFCPCLRRIKKMWRLSSSKSGRIAQWRCSLEHREDGKVQSARGEVPGLECPRPEAGLPNVSGRVTLRGSSLRVCPGPRLRWLCAHELCRLRLERGLPKGFRVPSTQQHPGKPAGGQR